MSPAVDPLIGSVIAGRYEVVRVIGKGGMGTIYEVRNTRLGRSFALKTIASGADDETLARFRREAEIVAKLTHPNILDIVDWDVLADGSPCMIMEYLRGEDLGQRLKENGPLAWPDFARVADQVLSALSVAHRAGVVHRDLKPQNIFLAGDDLGDERVKLLDFGISKLRDARTFTTTDQKVMGTPSYMPPEQAEGKQEEVAPPSDIWSMAAIFYEMATAKVAFAGPSIPSILYRVCHGRPEPLAEARPDAPAALVELIERALTIDMAARPTVDQLRADLRAALSGIPGVTWSEPLRARNSNATLSRSPATPAAGVPKVLGRSVDSGPAAMAATFVGGAATLAAPAEVPSARTPVAAMAMTMSTSMGEAGPTKRSRWPLVMLLFGAAVVAGAIVVATRARSSKAPSATVASSAAQQPGAADAQAEPPPPPPPPEQADVAPASPKISWTVESSPTGADVYRLPSEIKVGVTPWTGELDRADGVAVFVLKKAGFGDQRVELDLHDGGARRVELAKVAAGTRPPRAGVTRGSAAGSTGGTTTTQDSGGRQKGEPVDPFKTRKKGEPVDPFKK